MRVEQLTFTAAFFLAQRGAADMPQNVAPLVESAVPLVEMSDSYQNEPEDTGIERLDTFLCIGTGVFVSGMGLILLQARKAGRRTVDPMSNSDPDRITLDNGQPMRKTPDGYVPDERTDN